jgi:hypothetical protein
MISRIFGSFKLLPDRIEVGLGRPIRSLPSNQRQRWFLLLSRVVEDDPDRVPHA